MSVNWKDVLKRKLLSYGRNQKLTNELDGLSSEAAERLSRVLQDLEDQVSHAKRRNHPGWPPERR